MDEDEFLLTNFDEKEKELYAIAVVKYGDINLRIEPNAYDCNGNRLSDCYALRYYGSKKDLSDFWELFESIETSMT